MRKYFLVTTFLLSGLTTLSAQENIRLTLDDALMLAREQSLQTFLNQHYFMIDYWNYRNYRAYMLPTVSLQANPLRYFNISQLRYNSVTQTEEFIRTENLSSDMNLNISQRFAPTGGRFFVSSELGRIENFGRFSYTQFSSVPFSIGYRQDLFGFNEMKWLRKIEPLKFEKAKKEFLESVEDMHILTVRYFFDLVRAGIRKEIASTNAENTGNLLQVADNRFRLGTVNREELLDMRLSQNNAEIELQEAMVTYRESKERFLSFLMLPVDSEIEAVLPQKIIVSEVDAYLVLENASKNNSEILQLEQNILENRRNVAQASADRHFRANVNMSYGVTKVDGDTQESGSLINVYRPEFDNHQMISVGLSIPILDWGRNKGVYKIATSQQQIAEIAAQQRIQQFEQNAITSAVSFNIRKSRVESAALSDTLASESYELTMIRFRGGQADVLRLTSSQRAKDNARLQYINALAEYWDSYFYLRRLTLYDFEKDRELEFNEEELLR